MDFLCHAETIPDKENRVSYPRVEDSVLYYDFI